MELIRSFAKLGKNDAASAGGKGASLGEMTQAGIPVPPGFVVLAGAFEQFLKETDLLQEIDAILHTVKPDEMHTVEHASEKIQALILAAQMPQDIAQEIEKNFKALGAEFVAVRSSATAEDSASAAWAGQLDSFLNTTEVELLKNVQRCWASLFTPRAIFYRFEKELHLTKISVAVVVQKMVASEVSGIAFSVHPVTEDRNQLIIEAGWGLGEAIVSGQVTPDSYVVEKSPRKVIDINVATQARGLYKAVGGGNEWQDINEPKASAQVLNEAQILELSELILKIEDHYGFPCDIEWAYEAGKFYIVQSRPITTLSALDTAQDNLSKLVRDNFTLTFESEGTKFLFEDLVYVHYMQDQDRHSLALSYNGHMREYTHNETLARMDKEGVARSVQETQKAIDILDISITEALHMADTFKSASSHSDEEVYDALRLLVQIMREYSYFDAAYWDSLYEKSEQDASAQKNIELVQQFKNDIRARINPIYFGEQSLLALVETKTMTISSVPTEALDFYREVEIKKLLTDGIQVVPEELQNRRSGWLFLRDTDFDLHVYSGATAINFITAFDTSNSNSSNIQGKTANGKGKTSGRVRLITRNYGDDPSVMQRTMKSMQTGEIVVSETTDPDLMEALQKAAAIITDTGGMLSHAAITARELNIPCIVGTGNASKILKTGDLVEVDAEKGIVRILEKTK